MHNITALISKEFDAVDILVEGQYYGRIHGRVTFEVLDGQWHIHVHGNSGGAYLWARYIQQEGG